MIVYEYPFNERIRTLLRLESLHQKFAFFLHQEDALQHHAALSAIFEMLEIVGRGDLKSDLLQELERQKQTLLSYRSNPLVASEALQSIVDEIDAANKALSAMQGKTGQHLRDNEWLMSIRGRMSIPGGACEFDLPSYYSWQQKSSQERVQDINVWFEPLIPFFNAVLMITRLLRESAHANKGFIANNGNFQQPLHGKNFQMLRLSLDSEQQTMIPEISANKYVLIIRFMNQDADYKLSATDANVPFNLALCGL